MSQVTSNDGTKIGYDQQGSGPPVILVGGAFQYRAFDPRTQELATLLAEQLTVINYDRRGRGESTDTSPYAVEREIEDIDALITEAGGSAGVFGMSSGAALALAAAASGSAITKLALYEPPYIVDDSRTPPPAGLARRLADLAASGDPGGAVELFLTTAADVPAEFVGPMRDSPIWPGFESVAHTLPYDMAVMGGYSVPAGHATAVTVPTLVADGGASPAWMRNAAARVAETLPDAKHYTLDGQSHDVAPAVLAPLLTTFFTA
jgi:pimeloyl-ACP methyl ester carboxylesterase